MIEHGVNSPLDRKPGLSRGLLRLLGYYLFFAALIAAAVWL